jgi:ATP-dependent DNA ligase
MFYNKRMGIMLCHPWEEKRFSRFPENFFIQPKLNGERCWVEWINDEPVFVSSYGNEFKYFDHLKEELKGLPKVRYDGELYKHGWSRERIHSAVSRKANKSDEIGELEFHIFDVKAEKKNQLSRLAFLCNLKTLLSYRSFLKVVPLSYTDKENWMEVANSYIEDGYEGVVLRDENGIYEEKRSSRLIKFKPTEKDIYLIIGWEQAVSIHGEPKEELGSFLVRSLDEDISFSVGTGPALTKEKREFYWKNRQQLVGKRLMVKHEKLRTINKKPIATVALEVID